MPKRLRASERSNMRSKWLPGELSMLLRQHVRQSVGQPLPLLLQNHPLQRAMPDHKVDPP